jgi:hypothetical protein
MYQVITCGVTVPKTGRSDHFYENRDPHGIIKGLISIHPTHNLAGKSPSFGSQHLNIRCLVMPNLGRPNRATGRDPSRLCPQAVRSRVFLRVNMPPGGRTTEDMVPCYPEPVLLSNMVEGMQSYFRFSKSWMVFDNSLCPGQGCRTKFEIHLSIIGVMMTMNIVLPNCAHLQASKTGVVSWVAVAPSRGKCSFSVHVILPRTRHGFLPSTEPGPQPCTLKITSMQWPLVTNWNWTQTTR